MDTVNRKRPSHPMDLAVTDSGEQLLQDTASETLEETSVFALPLPLKKRHHAMHVPHEQPGTQYYTPQNTHKGASLVKPNPFAFHSTGLLSKKVKKWVPSQHGQFNGEPSPAGSTGGWSVGNSSIYHPNNNSSNLSSIPATPIKRPLHHTQMGFTPNVALSAQGTPAPSSNPSSLFSTPYSAIKQLDMASGPSSVMSTPLKKDWKTPATTTTTMRGHLHPSQLVTSPTKSMDHQPRFPPLAHPHPTNAFASPFGLCPPQSARHRAPQSVFETPLKPSCSNQNGPLSPSSNFKDPSFDDSFHGSLEDHSPTSSLSCSAYKQPGTATTFVYSPIKHPHPIQQLIKRQGKSSRGHRGSLPKSLTVDSDQDMADPSSFTAMEDIDDLRPNEDPFLSPGHPNKENVLASPMFHPGMDAIIGDNPASLKPFMLLTDRLRMPWPEILSPDWVQHLRRGSLPPLPHSSNETYSASSSNPEALPLDRLDTHFHVLHQLGQGVFGVVYHVQSLSDGLEYAIKKTLMPFTGPKDALKKLEEVEILWALNDSRHCVRLQEAWVQSGFLYLQMELCPGGTLDKFLLEKGEDGLDEPQIWTILSEICLGLRDIHDKGIVHLDLKPENIFIASNGRLKIGDFGLAAPSPVMSEEREGDRTYLAPEIWSGHGITPAADIFSLGLIALEVTANIILPENGPYWSLLRKGDLSCVDLSLSSPSLVDIIKSMIVPEPERRPTARDFLEHPLINQWTRAADGQGC